MPSKDLIFNIIGVDKASKTFESVGRKAEGAGSKLSKFGVVGVAAFAAVGFAAFELGKKSVDAFQTTATEALTLQRVMGGTAQTASRLNFAAEETGVSQAKLALGIKMLSTHLAANDKAWKSTGLSVKSTTEALPKLADLFAKMPAGAQKSALAVKLFGRSGLELLPLLNRGSAGLAALSEESDKLGHTLSGPQVAAVYKVTQAHRQFSAAVQGVEIQLGAALYPALTKLIPQVSAFAAAFAERAIPVLQRFGRWFSGELLPALDKAWQQIMPGVERAFAAVGRSLGNGTNGWRSIGNAIVGFITVASKVISVVLPVMIRLWGIQLKVYQELYKTVSVFGSAAQSAFHGMAVAAQSAWKVIGPVLSAVGRALNTTIGLMEKAGLINNIGGKFVIRGKSISVPGGKTTVNASGTPSWPGGVGIVGDAGAEAIEMPPGTRVHTASATARMRGASIVNHITINVQGVVGDKRATGKEIALALQAWQESTRRPLPFKTA